MDFGYLASTPSKTVDILPVVTTNLTLPFEKLAWGDFEKFCYQLGCKSMDCIETSYIYGRNGQKQDGIDLYFQKGENTIVWQIKCYQEFTATDVSNAVQKFREGKWFDKASIFTLCVSNYLNDTRVVDEISNQLSQLKSNGITFSVLNSEKLTSLSMPYPDLIRRFFGDAWYNALFPNNTNQSVAPKESRWKTNTGVTIDPQKLYRHGDFKFRVDDGSFYIEEQLPNGTDTHMILDTKTGAVKIDKPPHPLNEYKINVHPKMITYIEQGTTTIDGKNYDVIYYHLKWGKHAIFFFDETGLVDLQASSRTFMNHTDKTINVLDISEDAIDI